MPAHPANSDRDRLHWFLSSVAETRRRARQHIGQGAAGADQSADRDAVLRLLHAALDTEVACVLRYRAYSDMDPLAVSDVVRTEFRRRAHEEQIHADRIAARIVELGGEPNPAALHTRTQPGSAYAGVYAEDEKLTDMLAEDLIAERIAIDTYREIIGFLGEHDPPTRRLFEAILEVEHEHAEGLAVLRDNVRLQDPEATGSYHAIHEGLLGFNDARPACMPET
jgi:bacterioferritin